MKKNHFVIMSLVVMMVVALATSVSAAPGTPTARWVTTSATTAEIRVDGLTNGGASGNGAISWDFYFRIPNSIAAPYPGITITPGPQWTSMSPCSFASTVSAGQPGVGGAGTSGYFISGYCTAGVPANPVTGDNVLIATIVLDSCPATGFIMDLATGTDAFGAPVSQILDRSNDPYTFTDSDLTDGSALCMPTAVTMSGMEAASGNVAPFAAASWPMLAGLGAVAAGGVYALSRRKR